MKIKNNKNHFMVLQLMDGIKSKTQKFKPYEIIDMPYFKDLNQAVNRFLFNQGKLSVLTEVVISTKKAILIEEVVLPEVKKKEKEVDSNKELKKEVDTKKNIKKSKVEKAIESADSFVSGDTDKKESSKQDDLSEVDLVKKNNKQEEK